MNLADAVNEAIVALWSRADLNLRSHVPPLRMPLVYPDLKKGGLLVVGMNPSFSAKAFAEFLRGEEWAGFDPVEFYAWQDAPSPSYVERARAIERQAQDAYRGYYGKFADAGAELGLDWQHVDLFLVRETKQEDLPLHVAVDPRKDLVLANLNDFGLAQVDLCIDTIRSIAPEMVVVANAAAARIVQGRLASEFDDDCGHHWCSLDTGRVPMFFSSMWTGVRALDLFSLERLRWQMRRARARQLSLVSGSR